MPIISMNTKAPSFCIFISTDLLFLGIRVLRIKTVIYHKTTLKLPFNYRHLLAILLRYK